MGNSPSTPNISKFKQTRNILQFISASFVTFVVPYWLLESHYRTTYCITREVIRGISRQTEAAACMQLDPKNTGTWVAKNNDGIT
jgi:hypothetical protein